MYNLLVDGILSYAQHTYILKHLQDEHIFDYGDNSKTSLSPNNMPIFHQIILCK